MPEMSDHFLYVCMYELRKLQLVIYSSPLNLQRQAMGSPSAEACRGEWHSPDHQRGSHHTGVLHFITLVALRKQIRWRYTCVSL